MFTYNGNIHVYCPRVGAYLHIMEIYMYTALGDHYFGIINIQSYCAFPARVSL